jgi:hypothetical protein
VKGTKNKGYSSFISKVQGRGLMTSHSVWCVSTQNTVMTWGVLSLQQAIKRLNEQQKLNGHVGSNGSVFYEQHDAPPSSYTTEPRHRAFVNGVTK